MDEEQDKGTQADVEKNAEGDSQAEGTTQGSEAKAGEQKIDYEKQYKELQTAHTRASQENAELRRQVLESQQAPEEDEDLNLDDEGEYIDRKTAQKMINTAVSSALSKSRMESANAYFRKTYPELADYENAIGGILQNPKNPPRKGASPEERIDAAVKEYNGQSEEQRTAAVTKAEAEEKARQEQNTKASGLGSSSTAPVKGDEGEPSDEQELAARKQRSAKQRNII